MKPKKIVYLSVEVKKREFKAKCLFATVLSYYGYTVVLCPQYTARKLAANFKPGVFFDKNYNNSQLEEWEKISENGSYIYAWNEETMLGVFEEEFFTNVSENTNRLAQKILLWGNIEKRAIESLGFNFTNMTVVGNPRIDLISKDPALFYHSSIKNILGKYGGFVLINLNFPKKYGKEKWIQMVKISSQDQVGKEYERRLGERYDMFESVLNEYCGLIDELSACGNFNIVLRPHPSEEDIDYWINRFKDKSNVFVSLKGDSNAWICASKVMIHSGCTTALESFICGKISIYYNPIMEKDVGAEFSLKAESRSDVLDLVKKCFDNKINRDSLFNYSTQSFVNDLVMIKDDCTASERIVEILEKNDYDDDPIFIYPGWNNVVNKELFKDWIKSLIGKYWSTKFEYTYSCEVKRIIKNSCKLMGYKDRFSIRHPATNVFVIRKK